MRRIVLAVALGGLGLCATASAQMPSGPATSPVRISFVVRPVLSLSVDPELIDLGDVPIEAGNVFRSPVPLSIRIRANTSWTLAAGAAEPFARSLSGGRATEEAATPIIRLENLGHSRGGAVLLGRMRSGSPGALLSGGSTGPEGMLLRPDLLVEIPPAVSPGTYRLRVVVELRGTP